MPLVKLNNYITIVFKNKYLREIGETAVSVKCSLANPCAESGFQVCSMSSAWLSRHADAACGALTAAFVHAVG